MKRFQILNVLLLLLLAFATWQTVQAVRRGAPVIAARESVERRSPLAPIPARRRPVAEIVAVISSKDLFDISRKPPVAGQTGDVLTDAPPAAPPSLKLNGVVGVGDLREALVTDANQANKQLRVRLGEDVGGWRVTGIEAEEVSLEGGANERVVLRLEIDPTARSGVALGLRGQAPPPPQRPMQPGGVAGKQAVALNDATLAIEKRREEARQRAQRARERLKRLREEAALRQQQ